MLLLELKEHVSGNSYLFLLKPYKGNTSQNQERDVRSLLKHSVQENSQGKERRMASLTGWVHAQPTDSSLIYQSQLSRFLTKYWLWKKCLAQTSRTVNSCWLHICIKHRSSGRCAFWHFYSCLTVVFRSQASCVTSPVVDCVHADLFTWLCLFFGWKALDNTFIFFFMKLSSKTELYFCITNTV